MAREPWGVSELERYLHELCKHGWTESSGQFTLSREQALQKLREHHLPRLTSWILKVVQAAVSSGASHLKIQQNAMETRILFHPQERWEPDQVEYALQDPHESQSRSLDYLKRGLWSIGFHQTCPFLLGLSGSEQGIFWSGRQLGRRCVFQDGQLRLSVSHNSNGEILPVAEAARVNGALFSELRGYAYTCPIPLFVDGRRLDSLLAEPAVGRGGQGFPFQMFWGELAGLALPVPPGTFDPAPPSDHFCPPLRPLRRVPEPERRPACACMLSAGFCRAQGGWLPAPLPVQLNWIVDGVVASTEVLRAEPQTVGCAVFATAHGLPLDVSGSVVKGDLWSERRRQLVEVFAPMIDGLDLKPLLRRGQPGNEVALHTHLVNEFGLFRQDWRDKWS